MKLSLYPAGIASRVLGTLWEAVYVFSCERHGSSLTYSFGNVSIGLVKASFCQKFIELLAFRVRSGLSLRKLSVDKVKREINGELAGPAMGFMKV